MDNGNNNFGEFLCMLREKKGLTQDSLAQQLGIPLKSLSKWENGTETPTINVVNKLAEIFEVRPEELMSGGCFTEETVHPDALRFITERYEYRRRVASFATTKVKLKRMVAWLIDWNIIGAAVLLIISLCVILWEKELNDGNILLTLVLLLLILSYPLCFILRDFIMKGRSLGKRIMGLTIIDKKTGNSASRLKCLLRNLSFFIYGIDFIVLLIMGTSLGDMWAGTLVVSKKDVDKSFSFNTELPLIEKPNIYSKKSANTTKVAVISLAAIFLAVIVFAVAMFGFVFAVLENTKDTEEYSIAYSYLIESKTFDYLNVDENDVKLTGYSVSSGFKNGRFEKTAVLNFKLRGGVYSVTCHEENDVWYVCDECTEFD